MHEEVRDWFGELRRQYLEAFVCDSVLECGSYNVNGSVRGLFAAREYVGLDWRPGPGVDVVSLVHEYQAGPAVSTRSSALKCLSMIRTGKRVCNA